MAMVVKKKLINDTADKSLGTQSTRAKKATTKKSPIKKSTVVDNIKVDNVTLLNKVKDSASYADIFNEPRNSALIAQYVRTYQANQRQGNAHTKTRGEVAGSGRKPWKQKGTGRSRVGSIRTPVWRHGGVSHGPLAKDWSMTMPKKMKAKAFIVALSDKVLKSQAYFTHEFKLTEGRTKEVVALIKGWNVFGKLVLVVDQKNQNLEKGARNLTDVEVVNYKNLNTYQVLGANAIVFEESALKKIGEKYAKNK